MDGTNTNMQAEDSSSDNTDFSDTWLIVPCYNEGQVIRSVLENALQTFPNIVGINDGSADNSGQEIHAAGAYLVNHPVNLGQGAAIQTGVEFARTQPGAKYFVTFDADGQHQVKDVVRMVNRLREEPLDIVVGTRFGRPRAEGDQVPLLKRIVLRIVVMLSPKTRKLGLSDAHNGLRAFNKTVADGLDLRMNGMSHASEFIDQIIEHKWRVAEEPVDILYTEYSLSKGQSLFNGINIIADGILARRL